MARLTKKQLLIDLEFLHEHAARWKGYYSGHPVDEDDEDSPDEGDAFEAECNAAKERIKAFMDGAPLPKPRRKTTV